MKLASQVIAEGVAGYNCNFPFTGNPYPDLEPKDEFMDVDVMRVTPFGRQFLYKRRVRIETNNHRLWATGWSLAEMIDLRK